MNCNSCGANLPPGAAVCPRCGAATPYNASSPGGSQYQPTVPAEPYGMPQPSNDPTYLSSPYGSPPGQPIPPTSYGAPPPAYDPSQPNPYGSQANPYGATVPQDPYSSPAPPQQPGYPGSYPPPVQPKRKSRAGLIALIIGIVVLVLIVACVGILYAIGRTAGSAITNATATLTATVPTPTPASTQTTTPSGSPIVPAAASMLANPRTASAIDSNFSPTTLTTTFNTNQQVYVTFSINTHGQTGFAEAKWYINGKLNYTNIPPLTVQSNYDHGFFRASFGSAGPGAVELYWCTQSDCSDAQLATFTTFTVTSATGHTTGQPPMAMMDIDRAHKFL